MKYITLEKNEYFLKLLEKVDHKSLCSFWLYDIFQINDEITNLPEELQNALIELPENVAKASWFSHIDLNQRKTMNIKVEQQAFEWVKESLNIPKSRVLLPRDKFTYTITEEDEKNSVQFIKTILLHYTQRQFDALSEGNKTRYNKKVNGIKSSIEACITNYDCHTIMHNHFNYAFIKVDPETKQGTIESGAKWDIIKPSTTRVVIDPITEEILDTGPTIDNIDPKVFKLTWEIGDPVEVKL